MTKKIWTKPKPNPIGKRLNSSAPGATSGAYHLGSKEHRNSHPFNSASCNTHSLSPTLTLAPLRFYTILWQTFLWSHNSKILGFPLCLRLRLQFHAVTPPSMACHTLLDLSDFL